MLKQSLTALGLGLLLCAPAFADSTEPGRKSEGAESEKAATANKSGGDQRSAKQKKEQGEKKGALKEQVDPAKDAKAQRANIAQLKQDAEIDKRQGNHVGAWAAEGDEKHAQKLLEKDQKLLQEGKTKSEVDGQTVKK
jgi:hypothetical protein